MKKKLVIYSSAFYCLLVLTGCNVNVQMSPIELSMRKNMQEDIATSVASAITAQIPEIKKQLLTPTDKALDNKTNMIVVDLSDKPAGITGAYHVSPKDFDGLTSQAELLDKKTPVLLYSATHKPELIQKATEKLDKLGFKHVGVYTGAPELIKNIR